MGPKGEMTVRRNIGGPGMESLTFCQANRTRVGVRTVRRNTASRPHIMESLTNYHASRTRVVVMTVRKGPSWTWHKIAHNLSIQQDQSGRENIQKACSWA